MRTVLVASLALGTIVGAALAEPTAPAHPEQAPLRIAQASAGASPKAAQRARNGRAKRTAVAQKAPESARGGSSVADVVTSCLAMWEPATHMTRREWARACRRVSERLEGTRVN